MDKQKVIYPHNGIWFWKKNEMPIQYGWSLKTSVKWKKPVTHKKTHIVLFYSYVMSTLANLLRQKAEYVVL